MNASAAGGRVFTNYADEAWQASLFRPCSLRCSPAAWPRDPPSSVRAGRTVVRRTCSPLRCVSRPWPCHDHVCSAVRTGATAGLGVRLWRSMLLLLSRARPGLGLCRRTARAGRGSRWFFDPELLYGRVPLRRHRLAARLVVCHGDTPDFPASWPSNRTRWPPGRATNGATARASGGPGTRGRTRDLQRFALRWIGIGVLLVVCAAITRIDVCDREDGIVRLGLRGLGMRRGGRGLVCYFLAGLLLMSQGRLAVLRGRWYNQDVEVREIRSSGVGTRTAWCSSHSSRWSRCCCRSARRAG